MMPPLRWPTWAVGIAAVLVHLLVLAFMLPEPGCDWVACDFIRHYLPTAGYVVQYGVPSLEFLYPPLFGVMVVPFGWLPPGVAEWAWVGMEMFALWALVVLGARWFPGRWFVLYAALLATSSAMVSHTVWGQLGVPLAVLVLLSLGRGWAWPLGLAIAIKIYPAAFLAWWLLRRKYRFVAVAVSYAVLFTLLPIAKIGPHNFVQWFRIVNAAIGRMADSSAGNLLSQTWYHVLGRDSAMLGNGLGGIGLWGAIWLGLLICGAWAVKNFAQRGQAIEAFATIFAMIPLVTAVAWPHYMVTLPLAQVVLLRDNPRSIPGWLSVLLASALVPLVTNELAYVAYGIPMFASCFALAGLVWLGREAEIAPVVAPVLGRAA